MKKVLRFLLFLLILCVVPAVSVGAAEDVVFVRDGGNGSGSSQYVPVGSLERAYKLLPDGGTIVVCGPVTVASVQCPAHSGTVTVTSVYDGVDHRRSGAKLSFGDKDANALSLGGDTVFRDIVFEIVNNRARTITCNGNAVVFDTGVECIRADSSYQWLGITVGSFDSDYTVCDDTRGGSLTVNAGSWQIIRGGNRGSTPSVNGDVRITISGGTIEGNVVAVSGAPILGNVYITLCGGIFAEGAKVRTGSFTGTAELYYDPNVFSDLSFVDKGGFVIKKIEAPVASADRTAPDVKSDYGCAVGLHALGLVQGYDATGTDFGLADSLTRAQAVVQVIRFLGVEDAVKAGTYETPFTDVPDWAANYVSYAYANGIVAGRSATEFAPDDAVEGAQFLTLMLRAIGYSDAAGDFVWNDPFALAKSIGMTERSADTSFTRGDAFRIAWNTLYATAKSGAPVYEQLAGEGVLTEAELDTAASAALSAAEPTKETSASPIRPTGTPAEKEEAPTDYYILTKEEYMDKTTAGFLGQIIGFLSDYKYVWNSNGTPKIAMPDTWWLGICRGNDVAGNPYHTKIIKLFYNEETGQYDNWIADAYSIDILGQHILRNMREKYGTFTTKVITDGWIEYAPWDMGGGSRYLGAYALASKKGYITPYLGSAEYGNQYSWCQEPWIGNDGLGMAAAGMPNVALDLTKAFGRVTGDSDNVRWLDFVATMSSMAYFESDIETLINTAAQIFPADSYERQIVDMAYELHDRYPDNWRRAVIAAEKECSRRFYYLHTEKSTNEQGRCEVNFAFMLLALLYGEGDYMETAKILSLCGYDTRGTIMLPILGIIGGMDVIPEEALAVTWQDGKGEIVNKAVPETVDPKKDGVWMFAEGLPERYTIAGVIELYRENFEWLLVQNGGKIVDDTYYIPKQALQVADAVSVGNANFESGTLENFTAVGNANDVVMTAYAYWGEQAVQIYTARDTANGVYATVSGLEKGATYRMSAYVIAANNAAAHLFARETGAEDYQYASIHYQPEFVKRDLVFVATAETMELGLMVPAQNAYGYAIVDEIEVCRIAENTVEGIGEVKLTSKGDAAGSYNGKISFEINGKTEGEVYMKVYFSNTTGGIVDASVTVNGDTFRTVPFYKTGTVSAPDSSDFVYVPILLTKDTNKVTLDVGTNALYITGAEIVTVKDRLLAK